jgi:hypothetical protein
MTLHRGALSCALAAVAACGDRAEPPPPVPPGAGWHEAVDIDHLILAIDSLERGVALLESVTGVRPARGGAHPGRGTQNALLSLGEGRYLELLAPNPADTSATAREGAAERDAFFGAFRDPAPMGWAVRVADAVAERDRLRARGLPAGDVAAGSRARPDGRVLRWQTFDPWGEPPGVVLPFVIAWDAGSPHPSADAPAGCTLVELSIASPEADGLRARFERAGWPVAVRAATEELLEFTLDCPAGRVHFR